MKLFLCFKFKFIRMLVCSVIDLWLGNAALQWQLTRITFFFFFCGRVGGMKQIGGEIGCDTVAARAESTPEKYSNEFSPSQSNQLQAENISQWWNSRIPISKSHSSPLFFPTIPSEKLILWKSVPLCRSSALKCQVLSRRNKDRCFVALARKLI